MWLLPSLENSPFCFFCQAKAEHRILTVFPVPVGDSNKAFLLPFNARITHFMYFICDGYASNGNKTGISSMSSGCRSGCRKEDEDDDDPTAALEEVADFIAKIINHGYYLDIII